MTIKDTAIAWTESATNDIFKAARRVPADKLEWKPLDAGRSVLDQLQECAQSPLWALNLLRDRKANFEPSQFEQMVAERKAWTTIDACERVCRENIAKLNAAIEEFPVSDLDQTLTLPFGDGMVMTYAEIMMIHYWNVIYHFGQVSYIQTLYGDTQMG